MKTRSVAALRLLRWRLRLLLHVAPATARRAARDLAAPFRIFPMAGGSGGPPPEPAPPAPTPPAPTPPEPTNEPKTFTQAEIDAIVRDRLARDRKERPTDAEIAEMRDKATRFDEVEQQNKTELQRAVERAEKAEAEKEKATTTAQRTLRQASIITAAATSGAIDPAEVYAILAASGFKVRDRDNRELEVTVGDDGQVTGGQEAVAALLASKQHLVGQVTPDPGPGGGGARIPVPPKDLDDQIAEAEKAGDWKTAGALKAQKLARAQAT